MHPISSMLDLLAARLRWINRSRRGPRLAKLGGKVYLRYSGAHLRALRARNGVGSPHRRREVSAPAA